MSHPCRKLQLKVGSIGGIMATQYGFRLWELELRKGHTREEQDWTKATLGTKQDPVSFVDSFADVAKSCLNVTRTEVLRYRKFEQAQPDPSGDREDTTPSIRLLTATRTFQGFEFTYRFGRRGSHDTAMAADPSEDAPLADKASSNPYRAYLYLPSSGTKAVLAAEARNLTCPGTDLMRLIGVSGKEVDEARTEDKRIGWWRYLPFKVTDNEQLRLFIKEGHANGVRLEKEMISGSGKRDSKTITVKQSGLTGTKLEMAKALGGEWFGFTPKELGLSVGAPKGKTDVERLASLIDLRVSADQFDDGGLDWEGPDGSTQFVKPEAARDVFTYRIGKRGVSPTDTELQTAIEARIRRLVPTRKWKLTL